MNPVSENLTGWSLKEATGKSLNEIFNIHNAISGEKTQNPVDIVLKSGRTVGLANHTVLVSKDGNRFHISDSAAPITDKDGKIYGVVLVFRDVSEEYKNREKIRESEEMFNNVLDTIPDMVSIHDTDLNILYCNWNGFADIPIKNRKIGTKCYRTLRGFDSVCPDCQAKNVIESKKTFQCEAKIADGRWVDLRVMPVLDENGECNMFVEWVRDISERKRLEENMVQSEKMLSIGGLAAGMAHEINNPLGGMVMAANVIYDRLTKFDKEKNQNALIKNNLNEKDIVQYLKDRDIIKRLDDIRDSGMRISDIITNMLSFSHKSDAAPGKINLPFLIERCISLASTDYDLKKKYDFRKIVIKRHIDENIPEIFCKEIEIQQVILNILRNGAEAMQEIKNSDESFIPEFTFRVYKKDKESVVIEIEDNGPGMSEELRKHVFEPFFTTKPVNKGTGLGLSVSYFIITKNHNGKIYALPGKNTGTCFVIELPL
jgi:PAS domain S-box-containing protein